MTFLFSNGDKKNTEIAKDYVGIQTKLQKLLYGAIEKIPSYRNGELTFHHAVEYSLNEYDGREYESLELVLMANEEELEVVNLLAETIVMEEDEPKEDGTEEIGLNSNDGNMENDNSIDSYDTNHGNSNSIAPDDGNNVNQNNTNTDNPSGNDMNGTDTPTNSKEPEPVLGKSGMVQFVKNIQIEEGKHVRLFLRAKNEAGFLLEYDLFSAVTSQTGPNGYEETEDYFIADYTIYDEKHNGLKL